MNVLMRILTVHHAVAVAAPAASKMSFDFELKRSRRRTLSLEVRAGKLIVRSPLFLSKGEILRFIEEKSAWIEEKIKKTTSSSGRLSLDQILFLGEKYLVTSDGKKDALVDREDHTIHLDVSGRSLPEAVRMFYIEQTKQFVEFFIDKHRDDFFVLPEKIRYKFYKGKWGSCSAKNNLSFNAYLASAPHDVIEYVVIHELCHMRIKNHSAKYWELVREFCPDFKRQRKYLKNNNIIIL